MEALSTTSRYSVASTNAESDNYAFDEYCSQSDVGDVHSRG